MNLAQTKVCFAATTNSLALLSNVIAQHQKAYSVLHHRDIGEHLLVQQIAASERFEKVLVPRILGIGLGLGIGIVGLFGHDLVNSFGVLAVTFSQIRIVRARPARGGVAGHKLPCFTGSALVQNFVAILLLFIVGGHGLDNGVLIGLLPKCIWRAAGAGSAGAASDGGTAAHGDERRRGLVLTARRHRWWRAGVSMVWVPASVGFSGTKRSQPHIFWRTAIFRGTK